MKTVKAFYISALFFGILASCQHIDKTGSGLADSSSLGKRADSAANTDSLPETKDETNQSKIDGDGAAFMKAAAIGSAMEIDLGKVALLNSEEANVKAFAAKMVADHTVAKSDLMKIAQKSGILLPSQYPADVIAHMVEMRKLKGTTFDKHYVDMMVKDHDKTVRLFESATSLRDDVLKDYAMQYLPVIQKHAAEAKELESTMK